MLTYEKAKKIGIDACIDKLGREFVMSHKDTASSAFGDRGDYVYCFVGVNDKSPYNKGNKLILTSDNKYSFVARCTVDYVDGEVKFLECTLP
ncbi:MAG: hypothetical protein IJ195_01140 [Lachnospiraceae bacterium]|jgi:hypothetical protein|nr:hypothetical protein [Lachnospiraceae bacterium]